jgi:TniQ
MRRSWIPPRRPGPLPEILLAENDEVLSSWLTRLAALYRARPDTLLDQLGISEVVPAVLDRRALPMDLKRLSVAVRSSPEAIQRMTFTNETPEALEFVSHRFPLWTCRRCASEFMARDLGQARLRTWFIAVASRCRRCGGQLTSVRSRTSRALHNIIADGEPYEFHARVLDRLAVAFETGRPVGAVTRAMKALAAPVPTGKQARYIARNRGRLPYGPDRSPPLLWQLAGTKKLRRLMHGYEYWRPPDGRPYAAWPPAGQVAATVGLTVLAAAGMAMWELLPTSGSSSTVITSLSKTS